MRCRHSLPPRFLIRSGLWPSNKVLGWPAGSTREAAPKLLSPRLFPHLRWRFVILQFATCQSPSQPIPAPFLIFQINPCRAELISGNLRIYLHSLSFLHTDAAHVVGVFPPGRQVYPAQSVLWLLMTWRLKEPGHQEPWHWPSLSELFLFSALTFKQLGDFLQYGQKVIWFSDVIRCEAHEADAQVMT